MVVGSYYEGNWLRVLIEHWDGAVWSVVPSPNPSVYGSALNAVVAVSTNDVWAVGNYDPGSANYETLTMHWNGTTWSVISSPNLGNASEPYGVAAVSANDVWAVGYYYSDAGAQTLAIHWNGTTWGVVFSPSPGTGGNYLHGVDAASADDVWAVGYQHDTDAII